MKKFEAKSLEEVYELATAEFDCSITDLDIDIVQQPSNGFLGFGRKNAIIDATLKRRHRSQNKHNKNHKLRKSNIKIEDVSKKIEDSEKSYSPSSKKKHKADNVHVPKIDSKEEIFDKFYTESNEKAQVNKVIIKRDNQEVINEVKTKVNELFSQTCYELDEIKVDFYNEETLYIEFNGADSALLIGKEGYRYKALSYILFNWINEKYGLMVRLEVAEFLKNQEEAIHNYLEPVIETIKEKGTFKTKPLDGILVHIALKRLRDVFPDKYVAVKTNVRGDKYVLVNEYRSKQQ